ncbi:hypothetical protein [Bradyrhizobium sp. SZCCHNRI20481]|uniref:hypothetical protein n=1 Tax=Bradyrhizobium sp. SZCCHNRI20481 TaxID=3057286 RepID=UPI0029162781|nr:hypothetical protein [Bradyrhizobium sp. SZCCHNRI20481]
MEILPRPTGHDDGTGPQMWVDEAIWGHRLYDEQTPWLTMMEFLGVLHAEHSQGRALRETNLNGLSYRPQQQLRLRNLLFNNPHIATVRAGDRSDDAMWCTWLALMRENAGGLDDADFGYLRDRFESFEDFAAIVSFLQSSAIEGASNKRWSSKFVFPFGPNALYEDANVQAKGSNVSTDRRFFARTGEVLYLMLCRSARVDELRRVLVERLFGAKAPYDGLVRVLQGEPQFARNERAGAYVPCRSHPVFDRLAEDWLSILDRDMPIYDAIPHLVTMTGLGLLLYQLRRASEVLGRDEDTSLVCEIVSPKRSVVRDLSADSFQRNSALPQEAIERYVRRVADTPEWSAAASSAEPVANTLDLLVAKFDIPDDFIEADEERRTPGDLLETLVEKAISRHKQHVGKIHGTWARLIGLSSRRASRRVRYAPTDRLLKTLVVCCVDVRMEFKDFLAYLHDRYGIVVGDHQAQKFISSGEADQEDFSDNARRLEDRLASLGLLKRLSDSCAYVENPFGRKVTR